MIRATARTRTTLDKLVIRSISVSKGQKMSSLTVRLQTEDVARSRACHKTKPRNNQAKHVHFEIVYCDKM